MRSYNSVSREFPAWDAVIGSRFVVADSIVCWCMPPRCYCSGSSSYLRVVVSWLVGFGVKKTTKNNKTRVANNGGWVSWGDNERKVEKR